MYLYVSTIKLNIISISMCKKHLQIAKLCLNLQKIDEYGEFKDIRILDRGIIRRDRQVICGEYA